MMPNVSSGTYSPGPDIVVSSNKVYNPFMLEDIGPITEKASKITLECC